MSELLVTQCPNCQTRFRLTPEQLQVAAGQVRCGACLEVFYAGEIGVQTPDPIPSAPDRASTLLHDDLDEPDLLALGLDKSIIDEVNPSGMISERQSKAAQHDDQPLSENPLVKFPNNLRPAPQQAAADESFNDLHEDFLATPPAQDFGPDFNHQRLGIQSLQPLPDAAPNEQAETEPSAAVPPISPPIDEQHGKGDRLEPLVTPLLLPELLDDALFEEPADPPMRPNQRPWLWGSLCLLALLALPAQFLYYNFDALARDQRSRALLENLCFIAQCELPARVDISRIRSANLLVRQDPEFPNALAINVILYNRADFEQPFPVLQMQFTDAGGRDVASRRFRPEEYLSGELAGVRLMPPQTPIHVGLSMLDPGPQAKGYSLEFLSP